MLLLCCLAVATLPAKASDTTPAAVQQTNTGSGSPFNTQAELPVYPPDDPTTFAARTSKPVIGIPVSNPALCGMDALLATVQMPPGFPVATVALDKAGARNAAWLAAQILALHDADLAQRLQAARNAFKDEVEKAGTELMQKHNARQKS